MLRKKTDKYKKINIILKKHLFLLHKTIKKEYKLNFKISNSTCIYYSNENTSIQIDLLINKNSYKFLVNIYLNKNKQILREDLDIENIFMNIEKYFKKEIRNCKLKRLLHG